jgi:hypothetical protein
MAYKIYNREKLFEALNKLSGRDFAEAERQARLEGETSVDIGTSRTFYAAVAAKALNKPLPDIMELPMREYFAITGDVGSFLLTPEESLSALQPSSDKQQ